MNIEIIATTIEDIKILNTTNIQRIELINSFNDGGFSPTLQLIQISAEISKIPIHVMLRPVTNNLNFYYSNKEIMIITDILKFISQETKISGIVFGALNNKLELDNMLLEKIIQNKKNLKLTFHRAIDISKNPLNLYKELLKYKEVDYVLTSGGANVAINGINTINNMYNLNPNQKYCKIVPASGINIDNINYLITHTNIKELHIGMGVRTNNAIDQNKINNILNNIVK